MTIQIPGNKGVPISPYPRELYEQLFGCVKKGCTFTLSFQIPLVVPPNALVLFNISDHIWRCPKCGVLQTTQQDLPRSIPLGKMELKKQGMDNGSGQKKRKRKGKDEQSPMS